jgi:ATP-dependent Clp protease ATP-binding subunit ClpC
MSGLSHCQRSQSRASRTQPQAPKPAGNTRSEYHLHLEGESDMAEQSVQALYDQAFQHWQADEKDKARELVDEALRRAPDDLLVHALAMYVKWDFDSMGHVPHAEFILDHDVHFKDTVNRHSEPHAFHEVLLASYHVMMPDEDEGEDAEPRRADLRRRYLQYAAKLLKAGYPIKRVREFVEELAEAGRYDQVILVADFLAGTKTAEEIGLPGLVHCPSEDDMFERTEDTIMSVFFHTDRDEEALRWCRALQQKTPEPNQHVMIGEVLCRLDQPEEAARQWIIALQKGWYADEVSRLLGVMCELVVDPQAGEKGVLWWRLQDVIKSVQPDRKATADKISYQLQRSIGDPDARILSAGQIEAELKIKLPPEAEKHYESLRRLWIPAMQGPHPYVNREKPAAESVSPRNAKQKPLTIERFGVDLTELASSGKVPPIVGREREIDALIRVLIRMEKNNPVLIGEAGVGKTAIAQGLAQRIVSGDVPPFLRGRRVFELTMSALCAGTMWRGNFEERMTSIIQEARDNPDLILFVDELHTIMGAGAAGRGDLDAANMVKPALAKGELRLIGATTTQEFARRIARDQAMARRFTPVRVMEMDRESTLTVLRRRREHWLKFHHVEIPDDVLTSAVDWVETHLPHRKLPDKAIDLLDESCAHVRTRMSGTQEQTASLTTNDVRQVLREWAGVGGEAIELPDAANREAKSAKRALAVPPREAIVQSIRKTLVAQDAAVEALSDVVTDLRLSLCEPTVPLTMLFNGPAGTGKSTAARAMARALWPDDPDRVLTLNMTDYAARGSLNRLIGAPLGYAQHEEGGLLSAWLKRKPFSMILVKNLPAAEPQALGFLGNLLREGTFTDAFGRNVSAADAVVVIHHNTSDNRHGIGFATASNDDRLADREEIFDDLRKAGVAARLLHCVSHVLPFPALSRETVLGVLQLHLRQLQDAFDQKGIQLEFTDALREQLASQFLKLFADRRNIESLIDRAITPRVCAAMLERTADLAARLVIDV